MGRLLNKIKQAQGLYKQSRGQGLSVKISVLILAYRVVNMFFNKFNIQEQMIQAELFDDCILPSDEVVANTAVPNLQSGQKLFIWALPRCTNIWGGGHYTLFRFIDFFAKKHNVKSIIFLYNYFDELRTAESLQDELNKAFSTDHFYVTGDIKTLPMCDAVIATTWQSAYFAKKIKAKEKFYFMQDYESFFYAAGTQALQANYSYSFGFRGVTGGNWLKNTFESYGHKAQAYIFSADRDIFYPANPKELVRDEVKRLFFYGRPSTPRRAYELGMVALEMIAKKYPNIEIVIAGLAGIAPPKFKCTLLGNLSLKATGELYRTCDIGIALSATNMSYLPVELMASGCPVISNEGPQVEWFCKNEHNALLVPPVPSAFLSAVTRLVESKSLRQTLAVNGRATIEETTWDKEMEKIYQYMSQPLG